MGLRSAFKAYLRLQGGSLEPADLSSCICACNSAAASESYVVDVLQLPSLWIGFIKVVALWIQVMIWSWLEQSMSLQFIGQDLFSIGEGFRIPQHCARGVLSNSFVHVLMYAYHALSVWNLE